MAQVPAAPAPAAPAADTNGSSNTAAAPAPTQRDVQRAALRDLVALAQQSATTEADIERQHAAGNQETDKEFETQTWAIGQRYNKKEEELKAKYAERLAKIQAAYDAEQREAKKAEAVARERVARENDPVSANIKSKYEQTVWLADSVLEATQGQIQEDLKKTRSMIADELAALGAMEEDATKVLNNFKQPVPEVDESGPEPEDADAAYEESRKAADQHLHRLATLKSPRFVVGAMPFVATLILCLLAGAGAQFHAAGDKLDFENWHWRPVGIAAGVALVACVLLFWVLLRSMARSGTRTHYVRFRQSLAAGRRAVRKQGDLAAATFEAKKNEAAALRAGEMQKAKEKFAPQMAKVKAAREAGLKAAGAATAERLARLEEHRAKSRAEAADSLKRNAEELALSRARELQQAKAKYDLKKADIAHRYSGSREDLERRLRDGLSTIQAPMEEAKASGAQYIHDWDDPAWEKWVPTKKFVNSVRFGQLEVDLKRFADNVEETPAEGTAPDEDGDGEENGDGRAKPAAPKREPRLALPPPFQVPVTLNFPSQASLLIQSDREGRPAAVRMLQMLMTRLLTQLPPGRIRFTILDPVGLGQNFAGFMHLADYDEQLVGTRIWTDQEQIAQRLTDLTEHMETVIQKYLRNEYETIDEYNAQADELAEPYRFLIVSDFPVGFEGDSMRRLSSIVTSGARCGVYTLIFRDTRQMMSSADTVLDDLEGYCVNIVQDGDRFVWKDDVFGQFPLRLDAPPTEEFLTRMLHIVGKAGREAKRVEVPFHYIAPTMDKLWTMSATHEMNVAIGKTGATRLQDLKIGKGVAQHALIAGKTGSGKSTLLHAMITNLAMWYSPDEVEFFLIDFKRGVEFKTYATHALPHARAIAVESDREFGLSVLQRLDAEIARRGEIFRKAGVQDLGSYRGTAGAETMPRTLLMIDEFQEFFTEDDKLAQEASLLLDRLVRQGRAFGIHVLLGSQTIGGSSGLARSTIGQMGIRIALMTTEADSQLILGDGNSAARLLSRPGEAIYNDAGGLVEGNSPFQVAYLSDERRDVYLDWVNKRADGMRNRPTPPIVFEGNAPADIKRNELLARLLENPSWNGAPSSPMAYVGDPVAIKDPTGIAMRRQSGANMLLVGQQEESALAIVQACVISLATQHAPDQASFYLMDGTPTDSTLAGVLPALKDVLPHEFKVIDYRLVDETMAELAAEIERRRAAADVATEPELYVIVYGLQRYRMLRKAEDDFSFSTSTSDEPPKINPGKVFADLLREGPVLGMHVITWIDTPTAIDRTLDRNSMRELDNRILFQMSANDSSNLIDSPAANKLGFFRALWFSEEQGMLEKFRPYAMPEKSWLEQVKNKLAARAGAVAKG